ncbi:PREDICTED: uncharacterized protein LOC101310355 [Fragaria vesca subsp. vesca]|uniref:uncharacterized protein LOC101310355 n=1 Tax=Fragaria vesca subsp. vesca TaxID=101020 RepID=UPI0002C2E4FD|nr:PREDICTED: uncharacterized protein LOC101310355 [Fragaria vesca subsp. vesca]
MAAKYQLRSISLPTRSHPTTARVEEELSRLQSWESTTSSASTSDSICRGLCGLEELYDCVDDLLQMASTQQLLSQHQQEKCMDELLDGSVKLLDICGITRDFMLQVKEHVFALQSALRRRKGDSSIETSIANYTSFSKKMKKDAKKLISQLKQADNMIVSQPLEQDLHLVAVIRVLRQVCAKNMSIFQSLLVFLAVPVSKSNRWSLVSKLMHKGVVACESQTDINGHELDGVDSALSSLCKSAEVEKIRIARKKLEALEVCIEGLESGLESVFRRLIKTRASLLNIISQ